MSADKPSQYTVTPAGWEKLKPLGREMRHQPTPAEDALWQRLRNRRLNGVKFRRQHAIGPFIVDFVCIDKCLIIEVDGAIHEQADQRAYDQQRQALLESGGFRVLRFANDEVLQSVEFVLKAIRDAMASE